MKKGTAPRTARRPSARRRETDVGAAPVDSFPRRRSYASLSVKDLLEAREHYHVHLANLENEEFWKPRSYQPGLPASRVPMLHVTGWYDGTLGGSLENFRAMRTRASAG